MNVESVRLLKTLKAGKVVWNEGTVFPNGKCPRIPSAILGEIIAKRDTVEVLSHTSETEKPVVFRPKFLNSKKNETQTVANTTIYSGPVEQKKKKQSPPIETSKPEFKQKEIKKKSIIVKSDETINAVPEPPKKKPKKSKLVTRK